MLWENGSRFQVPPIETLLLNCLLQKVTHKTIRSMQFLLNATLFNRAANNNTTNESANQHLASHAANGDASKGVGLLTTAAPVSPMPMTIAIDLNKLSASTAAVASSQASASSSGFSSAGDKEDSNLDAELMALAAQQMRSPAGSLSQTPTQHLKGDAKQNPAKWSVSLKRNCRFRARHLTARSLTLGDGSGGVCAQFDGVRRLRRGFPHARDRRSGADAPQAGPSNVGHVD